MLNNGNKTCEFKDEIVSYIYDEVNAGGRQKFEAHLTVCTYCTDEFAAISDARFSVFEWHKEEFAPLSTPEIVIPYAVKPVEIETVGATGFFAGLARVLSIAKSPLAIAGALAILLGSGFVAFNFLGGGESQLVASNAKVPPVAVTTEVPVSDAAVTRELDLGKGTTVVRASVLERDSKKIRQTSSEAKRFYNDVATQTRGRQLRKAPVLSEFKDDEDDTLRLSDMFDEIGG